MYSLTKQERQSLLREAGFTIDIPPDVSTTLVEVTNSQKVKTCPAARAR